MVDQTRFTTVRPAIEVMRDLLLPLAFRPNDGDTFMLTLKVKIPRLDNVEDGILSLVADRIDLNKADPVAPFRHRNKDAVFVTTARLPEDATPFDIDVTIPYGKARYEGASVTVSPEMEHIILDWLVRDIENHCFLGSQDA